MDLNTESVGVYKNSGRKFRKPFRGFVTSFANMLVGVGEQYERVGEYLKSNGAWEHFKSGELRTMNEQESEMMGGGIDRGGRMRETMEDGLVGRDLEGANKAKFNIKHIDNKGIKGDEGLDFEDIEEDLGPSTKEAEIEEDRRMTENECADNNYWKGVNYMKLEDLEADYE